MLIDDLVLSEAEARSEPQQRSDLVRVLLASIDDHGLAHLGPGLLGHDAIIDTDFSQRRRLQRLFLVVASNRQLSGLGIDEDTALVVRGDVGEVVGAGGVTFVDGRDTVRFDNAEKIEKGRQLTLSHLRVGIAASEAGGSAWLS